jgi:hypothetical protein
MGQPDGKDAEMGHRAMMMMKKGKRSEQRKEGWRKQK